MLVSAVEHYSYCPRQCGLIHLESVWDENVFTIRGSKTHQRADEPTTRIERGKRIERALPIWSEQYGLIGRADVVEFESGGAIVPVEYKSGKAKSIKHASVQLCAQTLCLEEMFGVPIPKGALYFVAERKRVEVALDADIRTQCLETIARIRLMMEQERLPMPVADKRCLKCSLIDACLPFTVKRVQTIDSNLFVPLPEKELP